MIFLLLLFVQGCLGHGSGSEWLAAPNSGSVSRAINVEPPRQISVDDILSKLGPNIRSVLLHTEADDFQRQRVATYFMDRGEYEIMRLVEHVPLEIYQALVKQFRDAFATPSVPQKPEPVENNSPFRISGLGNFEVVNMAEKDKFSYLTNEQMEELIQSKMEIMKRERSGLIQEKAEVEVRRRPEKTEQSTVSSSALKGQVDTLQKALDRNFALTRKLQKALDAQVAAERSEQNKERRKVAEQMLAEYLAGRGEKLEIVSLHPHMPSPPAERTGAEIVFQKYISENFPKLTPRSENNIRRRPPKLTTEEEKEALRRRSFGFVEVESRSESNQPSKEELMEIAEIRKAIMKLTRQNAPPPPTTTKAPKKTTTTTKANTEAAKKESAEKPTTPKPIPTSTPANGQQGELSEAERAIQSEKAFNTAATIFQGYVVPRVAPFLIEDGQAINPFAELLLSMVPANQINYLNSEGSLDAIPNPALNKPFADPANQFSQFASLTGGAASAGSAASQLRRSQVQSSSNFGHSFTTNGQWLASPTSGRASGSESNLFSGLLGGGGQASGGNGNLLNGLIGGLNRQSSGATSISQSGSFVQSDLGTSATDQEYLRSMNELIEIISTPNGGFTPGTAQRFNNNVNFLQNMPARLLDRLLINGLKEQEEEKAMRKSQEIEETEVVRTDPAKIEFVVEKDNP